jgi:hypothetical protein
MAAKVEKCCRCGKRLRKHSGGWSAACDIYRDDSVTIVERYCPGCTTAVEAAQVAANDAMMQSARTANGKLIVWPVARAPRLPVARVYERN